MEIKGGSVKDPGYVETGLFCRRKWVPKELGNNSLRQYNYTL